jgi:tRNA (cmo5U34)-methyltransferase
MSEHQERWSETNSSLFLDLGKLFTPFGERVHLRQFQLENPDWRLHLPGNLRCFLSCLVVHHLDGNGKKHLFQELFRRLQPGGALLIADLVAPANDMGKRYLAAAWDREVQRQSREATGDMQAYERFLEEEWNYYTFPDDAVDKPSTTVEQLQWLHTAGFTGVDVFWALAGHVLFGGFKPQVPAPKK